MQPQRRRYRFMLGILSLGLLAGVALTAHPAQAQEVNEGGDPSAAAVDPSAAAVGPYYALPSWDQKIGAATRFVVLTNWNSQAVLDKETGLVWQKTPASATPDWRGAREACLGSRTGGRSGWRLPAVHELTSLIQPSGWIGGGPTLPPGHPFVNVHPHVYWSATGDADEPFVANPIDAWFVDFSNGFTSVRLKSILSHTWCVRGGMNAAAY